MGFSALLGLVDKAVCSQLSDVSVTYTPSAGSPVVVKGVFDSNYTRVESPSGEVGVSSSGPAVFLRVVELPSDPSEDTATITISGVSYSIKEAKPDGLGGVHLLLFRSS
jgi:hypothetical protein